MTTKRKRSSLRPSDFVPGTIRGLQQELQSLDVLIVAAAFDATKRAELFAEQSRIRRRIEQLRELQN